MKSLVFGVEHMTGKDRRHVVVAKQNVRFNPAEDVVGREVVDFVFVGIQERRRPRPLDQARDSTRLADELGVSDNAGHGFCRR